jgi:hypothetical protein
MFYTLNIYSNPSQVTLHTAKLVRLLLSIRQVPASNLGKGIGYPGVHHELLK